MGRLLSNIVSKKLKHEREEHHPFALWLRKHSTGLIVAMSGVAGPGFLAGYFAQEYADVGVLSSLLIGFAPLIGLFLLHLLLALLIFLLLCEAERRFTGDENNAVPERETKKTWRLIRSFIASPIAAHYLSLKEHSPPAFPATPTLAF